MILHYPQLQLIYGWLSARLEEEVTRRIGWHVNRAYKTKIKYDGMVFLTNYNNVKGLEFPFVICVTSHADRGRRGHRNALYMMISGLISSQIFPSNLEQGIFDRLGRVEAY